MLGTVNTSLSKTVREHSLFRDMQGGILGQRNFQIVEAGSTAWVRRRRSTALLGVRDASCLSMNPDSTNSAAKICPSLAHRVRHADLTHFTCLDSNRPSNCPLLSYSSIASPVIL